MAFRQTHSGTIWREEKGSGAAAPAVPAYLVKSGSDWVIQLTGPSQGAFIDVESNGDAWLIDISVPVYLVSDGAGGYTLSTIGPPVAILVDDGAGGMTIGTDLTQTPIADLYYDSGGDLWVVRRSCRRWGLVSIGGGIQLY